MKDCGRAVRIYMSSSVSVLKAACIAGCTKREAGARCWRQEELQLIPTYTHVALLYQVLFVDCMFMYDTRCVYTVPGINTNV